MGWCPIHHGSFKEPNPHSLYLGKQSVSRICCTVWPKSMHVLVTVDKIKKLWTNYCNWYFWGDRNWLTKSAWRIFKFWTFDILVLFTAGGLWRYCLFKPLQTILRCFKKEFKKWREREFFVFKNCPGDIRVICHTSYTNFNFQDF